MLMYEKDKEKEKQAPTQVQEKNNEDQATKDLLVEQFSTVTNNLKNTIQETLKDVTSKLVQLKGQLSNVENQKQMLMEPETNEQKMKLSLMKRQLQNEYLTKIKNIIQHLILKDPNFYEKMNKNKNMIPIWDTPKIREILKQYIPLGNLILDSEFFSSKTMREFQPALNMDQFYNNCSKLIKIIKGERSN